MQLQNEALINVLSEGVIWGILFVVVYEKFLAKVFEQVLRHKGLYKVLKAEKGVIGTDIASDVIVMFGFGLEHFFAGGLILYGIYSGEKAYVRSGLLCEWGWESKDFLNLITATGPYKAGSVSETYRASLKFHHLPGMMTAIPIIYFGFHENIHVQRIGAIMILGGGVGVLSNVTRLIFKYGYNANAQFMFFLGALDAFFFFAFLRFAIFPFEVYSLVKDLIVVEQYVMSVLITLGFLMMSRFNVAITKMKIEKLMALKETDATTNKPSTPKMLKRSSSSFHPVVGDVE